MTSGQPIVLPLELDGTCGGCEAHLKFTPIFETTFEDGEVVRCDLVGRDPTTCPYCGSANLTVVVPVERDWHIKGEPE